MSFIDNIKNNWAVMQRDPYAAAKFEYTTTKYLVYLIMAIIGYQFIILIVNYGNRSSGGSFMRVAMIALGAIILFRIYTTVLVPKKKMLAYYENNPANMLDVKQIDVNSEVDQIFKHFEDKKK